MLNRGHDKAAMTPPQLRLHIQGTRRLLRGKATQGRRERACRRGCLIGDMTRQQWRHHSWDSTFRGHAACFGERPQQGNSEGTFVTGDAAAGDDAGTNKQTKTRAMMSDANVYVDWPLDVSIRIARLHLLVSTHGGTKKTCVMSGAFSNRRLVNLLVDYSSLYCINASSHSTVDLGATDLCEMPCSGRSAYGTFWVLTKFHNTILLRTSVWTLLRCLTRFAVDLSLLRHWNVSSSFSKVIPHVNTQQSSHNSTFPICSLFGYWMIVWSNK